MLRDLYDGFELEQRKRADDLEAARAAVETCETREEVAIARQRVTAAENRLSAVEASRNVILRAERDAEQLVERFIRWRACLAKCAELKLKIEESQRAIAKPQGAVHLAQQQYETCVANLAAHNQHLLKEADYPTSRELEDERKRGAALQATVDTALAHRNKLSTAASDAEGLWRTAMRDFDKSCFDERMARLPQEQKYQSPGVLSSVR